MQQPNNSNDRIVFYDSDCVLCSRTVRFLLQIDQRTQLKFAPLSGSTSKYLNIHDKSASARSVVFFNKGKFYFESTAALQIIRQLPYPWRLLFILIVFPPFIRNTVYKWIARNRYKWFGKTNNCDILQQQYEGRILE